MKTNVGAVDRVVRLFVAIAIFVLGIAYGSWWGLIGIIPLATAVFGWCPLYRVLKISGTKKPPSGPVETAPPEQPVDEPAPPEEPPRETGPTV